VDSASDLIEPLEPHVVGGSSSLDPPSTGHVFSPSNSESSSVQPPSSSNTEGSSSQGSSGFGGDRAGGQLSRSLSEGTEGSGSGRRDDDDDDNNGGGNTSDEANDDGDSQGPGVIWVAAFGLDMHRATFEAKLPHPAALLAPPGLMPSQPTVAAPFAPLHLASRVPGAGADRPYGKLLYAPRVVRLPGWRLTFRRKTPVLGVGLPRLLRASDLAAEEALARERGLFRGLPGEVDSDDDDDSDDDEQDKDKSRARRDGASSSDSDDDDIHARGPPRQRQRSGDSPDRGRSRARALAQEHAKQRLQAKAAAAASKPPPTMATAAAHKYRTNRDPDVEAVLWPVAYTPVRTPLESI